MKHLPAALFRLLQHFSCVNCQIPDARCRRVMWIIVLSLLWVITTKVQAQETQQSRNTHVTHLFTDFQGFWSSGAGKKNKTAPNNSHNVIGFTYSGRNFSTGVDDRKLTDYGIDYLPMSFQSLPVNELEITSGDSRFAQFGSMADGSLDSTFHTRLPVDFPVQLNAVLSDGINGLDISTGVTNMKAYNGDKVKMEFPFGNIMGVSEIDDGRPDILISQIAKPIATDIDEIWFADEAGNIVGNKIHINQTMLPTLGTSRSDFFDPNTGVVIRDYVNSPRDIRLSAYEASEFGLTKENYLNARQLIYRLGGTSDVGFIAFNMRLFELLVANDDAATTFEATSVPVDVLANDRIPTLDKNVPISIEVPPNNGSVEVANGQVVYLPNPQYIGTDTFRYRICSEFLGTCHSATVRIQVGGADLVLEKSLINPGVYIGEVAEFQLKVHNLGPFNAIGTQVVDQLPAGYDFVSALPSIGTFDSTTGSWYIGELTPGETAYLQVKAIPLSTGDYTNTAEVSSKMFDENPSDNKSSATPSAFPAISITTACTGDLYRSVMISLEGIGPWNRELAGAWIVHYTINGKPRIVYLMEPNVSLALGTSGTFELTRIEDSLGRSIDYTPTPKTKISVSVCKFMVNPAMPVKTISSQDS